MSRLLYAAKGAAATTSDLYTIDPATGAETSVGPIGFALTGLAFDPTDGTLYGWTSNNSSLHHRSLIFIDPVTGAGTLVADNAITSAAAANDICFKADGTLIGWLQNPARLASINKGTGVISTIGASPGIGADSGGGIDYLASVLYVSPKGVADIGVPGAGGLYSVDDTTGAITDLGPLHGTGLSNRDMASMSANPDTATMYGILLLSGTAHLCTIDVATQLVTVIGAMAANFDALAWGPDTGGGGGGGGPTVLRLGDPPLWRLIVTNLAGETLTVLDKRCSDRGAVIALDQPAVGSGLVPSDDPEINIPAPDPDSPAFLSHNTRLVYWLRREVRATPGVDPWVPRLSTLVMSVEDVAADQPTSRFTGYDPWGYLMCRPIRNNDGTLAGANGIVYTDARASDMALDLLANTVAVDGDVFIDASDAYLLEATDVIPGKTTFDRGISVGEAWQQLCETGTIDIVLRPIYDPENRPGKLCELQISKQAGQLRADAVMGWDRAGRSLTELSRLIDGTRLANKVLFYAGQGGKPVALQTDATSVAAYGEYWAQQFMVGKETQTALVELLALAQLQIRKNGAKSISFSPAPERSYLALRDYTIGDYVPAWASRSFREPMGVDYDSFDADAPGASGYLRVYAIPIEIDDNGVERPHDLLTASESANSF